MESKVTFKLSSYVLRRLQNFAKSLPYFCLLSTVHTDISEYMNFTKLNKVMQEGKKRKKKPALNYAGTSN
jgi:hypothetical protein